MNFIKLFWRKIFRRKKSSAQLLADLQKFTPDFMKKMVEKYGNENLALTADQFQKECNKAQLSYFDDQLNKNPNERL